MTAAATSVSRYGTGRFGSKPRRIGIHVTESRDQFFDKLCVRVRGKREIDKVAKYTVFVSPDDHVFVHEGRAKPVHIKVMLVDDTSEAANPATGNPPPAISRVHLDTAPVRRLAKARPSDGYDGLQ